MREEKIWLKSVLAGACDLSLRLNVKKYKPGDRAYGYGYVQKDTGLAHFRTFSVGLTDDEKEASTTSSTSAPT